MNTQLAKEYDEAAAWCAERGYTGELGGRLPPTASLALKLEVGEDREAFQARVLAMAYSLTAEAREAWEMMPALLAEFPVVLRQVDPFSLRFRLLLKDALAVREELDCYGYQEAAAELRRRLGGERNLTAYMNGLEAQHLRAEARR